MPYMPYSKNPAIKFDKYGNPTKRRWKDYSRRCFTCRVEFVTKNPNKDYCTEKCRVVAQITRRRNRNRNKRIQNANKSLQLPNTKDNDDGKTK